MSAPRYRYIFQKDTVDELEIKPVNSHNLTGSGVTFSDTGEVRISREIGGIDIVCSHDRAFFNIMRDAYNASGCEQYTITVEKFCKNTWREIYTGSFTIESCAWDFEKCRVSIKPKKVNENDCILDKGNKELNMYSLVSQEDRVTMQTTNAWDDSSTVAMEFYSQITVGNGTISPPGDGYTQVQITLVDAGTTSYLRLWARPKFIIECGSSVPSNYIELIPCSTLGDVGIYTVNNDAQTISTFNSTYTTLIVDSPPPLYFHLNEFTFNDVTQWFLVFQLPPADATIQQVPNGVRMMDLIRALVEYACPSVTVTSVLFDETETEYLTGGLNWWRNIVFFDVSDVIYPNASDQATRNMVSLNKILKELRDDFNVYWSIIDGEFILEHISWWKSQYIQATNLAYIKGYNVVSFDKEDAPKRHTFEWASQRHIDVVGTDIFYDSSCVGENVTNVKSSWITDWYYAINNPDLASSGNLFVAACTVPDVSNQCSAQVALAPISNTLLLNGHMAWSVIHSYFHLHERSSQNVYINGAVVPARSVKKTKQMSLSFQNKCFDVNLENRVVTSMGTGEINSWTYRMDANYLTLKILI